MQRKLLLTTTALFFAASSGARAADLALPAKVPVMPPPIPAFNWSGFYIGADIGAAFASGEVTDSLFGLSSGISRTGVIGGGVVGFDYQLSNFVIGLEGDFEGSSLNVTVPNAPTAIGTLQGSVNTYWLTTFAARFGVAFDRVLVYGKAGGGWIKSAGTITDLTTGASISASNTESGWLAGAGVEWAFAANWSAKLEYDYFAPENWALAGPAFAADTFTMN